MAADPPVPSSQPGEGWVECGCGSRHWGRFGAAGLLLTDGARVVLQHRAPWSHLGGTWAVPGGALHQGESAVEASLREATEEAGLEPSAVRVLATSVLRHPDWSYTTVLGRATRSLDVAATDAESVEIAWVPLAEVADRPLLPAFAAAWPLLRDMLDGDPCVVVDAANVVGSRPDGWWKDRRGAAARLLARLEELARTGVPAELLGLPGERWWPRWRVVTEGAARGVPSSGHVGVTEAPGSGDDAIVAVAAALPHGQVWVVTSDRELGRRVEALGARVLRPSGLLELLDAAT